MTGKVLDSNPKGLLVLILPLAVGMVLIYKAWRIILLVAVLLLGYIAWDTYQWQQKCQQIDPLFNQLIKTNQGKVTQADLVVAGIAKGRAATRYLQGKADEYGAYQRTVQGVNVYYFITASTLGTILDDSEPENEPIAEMPQLPSNPLPAVTVSAPVAIEAEPETVETPPTVAETITETIAETVAVPPVTEIPASPQTSPFASLAEIKEERKQQTDFTPSPEAEASQVSSLLLIQADLAKRLDTTSSTIARRKTEPDFTEWSQTKDPDGLGWCYDADSKMFKTV
jgi:hypothetical protein